IGSGVNGSANGVVIGRSGTATLTITGSGTLTSNGAESRIGDFSTANGTVEVTGGNWTDIGSLRVGSTGSGFLNISSGRVASTEVLIGRSAGGSGTVTLNGGSLEMTGDLRVGMFGNGRLNLNNGTVSNGDGNIDSDSSTG